MFLVDVLQTEVSDISHKKHEAEERVKFYQDRIREIQDNISLLQSRVSRQRERVEAAQENAERVCPRIVTERSHQNIESEAAKLKRRIAQELPDRKEQEEVEAQYVEATNLYLNTKGAIKNERKALKVRKDV